MLTNRIKRIDAKGDIMRISNNETKKTKNERWFVSNVRPLRNFVSY